MNKIEITETKKTIQLTGFGVTLEMNMHVVPHKMNHGLLLMYKPAGVNTFQPPQ